MTTPAQPKIDLERDRLLSRRQAAVVCGTTPKHLRQLACDRTGPKSLKRGTTQQSRVLYRLSDLEQWLSSRLIEAS